MKHGDKFQGGAETAHHSWNAGKTRLNGFVYRIPLGVDPFLISGASILLVTFLTTSIQAIKAAVANPIKSLRSE